MKRYAGAVVLAGFMLAACGGSAEPAPAAAASTAAVDSSKPAASSSAATTPPASTTSASSTTQAWSLEATKACRTFVNAVGNMDLVESLLSRYKPGMSSEEISVDTTGWGLAAAGMDLPPRLGIDAEPEVYDAMEGVRAALELPLADYDNPSNDLHPAYVKGMGDAFTEAVEVCTEVGVIS